MVELFVKLYIKAAKQLPKGHAELGDLSIIDGSLIDAVLSWYWADYRNGAKKDKVHIGFDLNRGIPKKIFLTDGNGDELPSSARFWPPEIQASWIATISAKELRRMAGRREAFHLTHQRVHQKDRNQKKRCAARRDCLLRRRGAAGTPYINQTEKEVRPVGYRVANVEYQIATDRHDLSAEQIAFAY